MVKLFDVYYNYFIKNYGCLFNNCVASLTGVQYVQSWIVAQYTSIIIWRILKTIMHVNHSKTTQWSENWPF